MKLLTCWLSESSLWSLHCVLWGVGQHPQPLSTGCHPHSLLTAAKCLQMHSISPRRGPPGHGPPVRLQSPSPGKGFGGSFGDKHNGTPQTEAWLMVYTEHATPRNHSPQWAGFWVHSWSMQRRDEHLGSESQEAPWRKRPPGGRCSSERPPCTDLQSPVTCPRAANKTRDHGPACAVHFPPLVPLLTV